MTDDRCADQRLTLLQPLDGWFGDYAVRLVDVSASGAQIEHDEPIPFDAHGLLRFWWRGEEVELLAKTARVIQPHRMGLHFVEESEPLRSLLARSSADMIRAFEANAAGDREANVIGDETMTAAWQRPISGYVVWMFEEGVGWKSRFAREPHQPPNGFTISAAEPDDQVEMLRKTYESGGDEARKMTRLLAEMSVAAES